MKTVDKPWGREVWIAYDNGKYAAKFLEINAGHRLSYQYHKVKHETLYLMEGKVKFTLENASGEIEEHVIEPGEYRVVEPGRKHRMEAVEDSRFFEVSTPELDDVVRVEDDYKR
ncbi:MAG TPA: cupin domain-containing protein [bacterium]|nr:cupin domain-containing protein [bacterium]